MSNHLRVNLSTTDHTISKLFIYLFIYLFRSLNKHLFKHRRWLNLDLIESQVEHRHELVSSIGNEILLTLVEATVAEHLLFIGDVKQKRHLISNTY